MFITSKFHPIFLWLALLAALTGLALAEHVSASPSDHPQRTGAATQPTLAPPTLAHTFTQVRHNERTVTLLVVAMTKETVHAIDLSAIHQHYSADAFDVISRFDRSALDTIASKTDSIRQYPLTRLLHVGPRGLAHIAAGTNYAAHGQETGLADAFLFPKLSPATGPAASVVARPGALLDYEVEVCARFSHEIRTMADFDSARKGFFLCGDFSDRATLVRNIDLTNILSGDGFADAKSGADRFPAGAFLVVPHDWQAFLNVVSISTYVDGKPRQLAHAKDMIKDLRTIVRETLDEAHTRTWSYQGGRISMVEHRAIDTGTAILTGTGEGVIFQQPDAAVMQAVMLAPDPDAQRVQIERYLAAEGAKRIYLQPGQHIRYESNYLGWIDSLIVGPSH